ncbi:uncharacterized protein JCM6883_002173 [Sporobolomyces salmoneus]|uniref:uncharacterized protein n=1 Tax=Sporobolomyces salmoneus TaxID=183962 RepID=UPI003171C7F6
MLLCRDAGSPYSIWSAYPPSFQKCSPPGYVFETAPGPLLARIVNGRGEDLLPEFATGMAVYQAHGCSVTVEETKTLGARSFRHELILTQVNPDMLTMSIELPHEIEWKGEYRIYSDPLNIEILAKFFKFSARLRHDDVSEPRVTVPARYMAHGRRQHPLYQ